MTNIENKVYTELDIETLKSLLINLDNGDKSKLKAIIIKFGATWCGPCKQIKNLCDKCHCELPNNVLYFDIDIDNNTELYIALKSKKMINGIPTILGYVKKSDRNMNAWYASDLSVLGSNINNINNFFNCIKKY